MMMKQEMASEIIRSRNQTERTIAREGMATTFRSAWDSVGSARSGIMFPILYGLGNPCRDVCRVSGQNGRLLRLRNSGYNVVSMMKHGLALNFLFLITLTVSAPWASSQQEGVVPAYNAGPPAKGVKLPAILDKDQLWGDNAQNRYQTHAYDLAAKIPAVLHQQPCYCYCDRMGHNSLHSCFESTHGARCDICLKELYYSYSQHQKGKTPAQIRKGIMQGEWRQVNLEA